VSILASSTIKTGRHDIAEILLKVALSTINKIKLNQPTNFAIHITKSLKIPKEYPERTTDHGKQLVSLIASGCESSAPLFVIYKTGREPTPYWVIVQCRHINKI
jgi:hypothetical protein